MLRQKITTFFLTKIRHLLSNMKLFITSHSNAIEFSV